MTNTTGPAQQRDQPTQLTATEVAELYRLTRAYGAAKFAAGLESGLGLESRKAEFDKAMDQADATLLALHNWQRDHGLSVAAMEEVTR